MSDEKERGHFFGLRGRKRAGEGETTVVRPSEDAEAEQPKDAPRRPAPLGRVGEDGMERTEPAATPVPPTVPSAAAPAFSWSPKGEALQSLRARYERLGDEQAPVTPAWNDIPDDAWLTAAMQTARMAGDPALAGELRSSRKVNRARSMTPIEREAQASSAANARRQRQKEQALTRLNERGQKAGRKVKVSNLAVGVVTAALVVAFVGTMGWRSWQQAQATAAAQYVGVPQQDIAVVDLSDPGALVSTVAPEPMYDNYSVNPSDPYASEALGIAPPPAGPVDMAAAPPVPLNPDTGAGFQDGYSSGARDGETQGRAAGQEEGYRQGAEDGRQLGYGQGQQEGYNLGRTEGFGLGQSQGQQEGFQQGYGRAQEEARQAELRRRQEEAQRQAQAAAAALEAQRAQAAAAQQRAAAELAAQRAELARQQEQLAAERARLAQNPSAPPVPLSPVPLQTTLGTAPMPAPAASAPALSMSSPAAAQRPAMGWTGGQPAPRAAAPAASMAWSGSQGGQGGQGGTPAARAAFALQAASGDAQPRMTWTGGAPQAAPQSAPAGGMTMFTPPGREEAREEPRAATPEAPEGPGGGQGAASAAAPSAPSPYRPFQTVNARLYTAALLLDGAREGEQLHVVAVGSDGRRWIGTPSPMGGGRLAIRFTQMVDVDGRTVLPLTAVAYDASGTPGLQAQTTDMAPNLLRNTVRAAATGVRDFAQASLGASRTVVSGGTVVQDRAAPNLWALVAGRALSVFELPEEQTFTRATYLPAGTPLVLMVTPETSARP